jgi:hypothetical protein
LCIYNIYIHTYTLYLSIRCVYPYTIHIVIQASRRGKVPSFSLVSRCHDDGGFIMLVLGIWLCANHIFCISLIWSWNGSLLPHIYLSKYTIYIYVNAFRSLPGWFAAWTCDPDPASETTKCSRALEDRTNIHVLENVVNSKYQIKQGTRWLHVVSLILLIDFHIKKQQHDSCQYTWSSCKDCGCSTQLSSFIILSSFSLGNSNYFYLLHLRINITCGQNDELATHSKTIYLYEYCKQYWLLLQPIPKNIDLPPINNPKSQIASSAIPPGGTGRDASGPGSRWPAGHGSWRIMGD